MIAPQSVEHPSAADLPPWKGPCHILALDGGGIRGLFSAAVLAKLEDDLNINIVDHFDLILGTSTGGIIAIGLGLGVRPRELVDFYLKKGPAIFPQPSSWATRKWRFCRWCLKRKYDNAPLKAALTEVFGDRLLGDSTKRLVIPSYNLGRDEVWLFKTPHHPRLRRDWRLPAWQVAMATTAAPTYFPAWRGIEGMRLIDGGVWANNPTMVGIIEARSLLRAEFDQIRVLSLGTCDDLKCRPDRLDHGGLVQWCWDAIEVIGHGQSVGTNNLAQLLIGADRVRRVDPRVPPKLFALDGMSTVDKLVAEAASESRTFSPTFAGEFMRHRASRYTPLQPATSATT